MDRILALERQNCVATEIVL